MNTLIRSALFVLAGVLAIPSIAAAQNDNLRVAVASMGEDMKILVQQIKTLRLEMDEMRRENARLRAQVTAATSNTEGQAQIANLSAAIESLRREYRQAD